mgnify:CR=1 FL=1
MGAKFGAVKTELILLGLAAAFLGVLLGISTGDRAAAEPVSVSAERALPPEEIEVVLVDLNTAGIQELATLPGIGQGLAQRIVDYRAAHGPFESPEALMEVSGIGEKKFAELRDYVTVGDENKGAES